MNKFKEYLINEDKNYLGNKIGDVLTSVQDMQQDIDNLGSRHMSRMAEGIVNQIRKILHGNWNPKYINKLKNLQKIAVAIQKTIDEKGDLKQIIPAAAAALGDISGKLGVRINNLQAPEQEGENDLQPQDFQPTPQEEAPTSPQTNPEQTPDMSNQNTNISTQPV